MQRRRWIGGLLALALCLQPLLVGCLGEETVEQGPTCETFDPATPAGTARLDLSGPKPRPAHDSFVLTVADEDGDTVEETRFHEDGCVGFSVSGEGTYSLTAQADDPDDEACTWEDRVDTTFDEDSYATVELNPRPVCR